MMCLCACECVRPCDRPEICERDSHTSIFINTKCVSITIYTHILVYTALSLTICEFQYALLSVLQRTLRAQRRQLSRVLCAVVCINKQATLALVEAAGVDVVAVGLCEKCAQFGKNRTHYARNVTETFTRRHTHFFFSFSHTLCSVLCMCMRNGSTRHILFHTPANTHTHKHS